MNINPKTGKFKIKLKNLTPPTYSNNNSNTNNNSNFGNNSNTNKFNIRDLDHLGIPDLRVNRSIVINNTPNNTTTVNIISQDEHYDDSPRDLYNILYNLLCTFKGEKYAFGCFLLDYIEKQRNYSSAFFNKSIDEQKKEMYKRICDLIQIELFDENGLVKQKYLKGN